MDGIPYTTLLILGGLIVILNPIVNIIISMVTNKVSSADNIAHLQSLIDVIPETIEKKQDKTVCEVLHRTLEDKMVEGGKDRAALRKTMDEVKSIVTRLEAKIDNGGAKKA